MKIPPKPISAVFYLCFSQGSTYVFLKVNHVYRSSIKAWFSYKFIFLYCQECNFFNVAKEFFHHQSLKRFPTYLHLKRFTLDSQFYSTSLRIWIYYYIFLFWLLEFIVQLKSGTTITLLFNQNFCYAKNLMFDTNFNILFLFSQRISFEFWKTI